ncbi:MAG: AMP-binding protein [Phycisphaerae bacterium]|nr:AMP-binding protein [Phycisphaerae bacterium]
MPFFQQTEETRTPEQIASAQREKLRRLIRAVIQTNRFQRAKLEAEFGSAISRPDSFLDELTLEQLPFTTRAELEADQASNPPYGTNLTFAIDDFSRMHQTSGSGGVPMRWLDRGKDWGWWMKLWAVIYRAGDVRATDRFFFPFSFGPFIGFWAAFDSAAALGNLCLPAGGMTTKARLGFMLDNEATIVCCTPTYALRMAEVAAEAGIRLDRSSIRSLFVAGEPGGSIPATRERIESAWGARVFDHAGMTEMGAYAFECVECPGGLHINESEFIAEVIDPRTTEPVPDGHEGELVLTNLGRFGMPLIRYRTGDLVRLLRGRCACTRWYVRLNGGILGRIDDMVTVRGNNVFPTAIEAILRRFGDVVEYRVSVDELAVKQDLRIEIEASGACDAPAALARRISEAIRDRLNFRPVVTMVPTGTLPRFEMKSKRWIRGRPVPPT